MNMNVEYCPNCNKEMKYKIKISEITNPYYMPEEYDDPDRFIQEEYRCKDCKIKYYKDNLHGEYWEIPKGLEPTRKQINTLLFINSVLNIRHEPLTKGDCHRFISKYFEIAKSRKR